MTLIYKDFECGNEDAILKLFQESFNKTMDISYWKWRYQDNILNKYMIKLAIDDDIMAAHYAVSPTEIFIQNKLFNAAISMTTMTHPDYRGMGLFTKLASELYESHQEELDIIYGVPNDNSIKGFIKYLDFEHIKDIPVMELDLSKTKFQIANQCLEIEKFDFRFDELFNKIKNRYMIILSRSSKYLNWRFCDNPINEYTITTYEANGELLGYAVTKIFTSGDLRLGDIVDIVALNINAFYSLVEGVCRKFQDNGVDSAKVWMNDNEYIDALRRIGFIQTDERFHFIVKSNTRNVPKEIKDFNNWYITMSDIDIF